MYAPRWLYNTAPMIRISVRPHHLSTDQTPGEQIFIFAYRVEIDNLGPKRVCVLGRRWNICEASGRTHRYSGDDQLRPQLPPGERHQYQSYWVVRSPEARVTGAYQFLGSDDVVFEVPFTAVLRRSW